MTWAELQELRKALLAKYPDNYFVNLGRRLKEKEVQALQERWGSFPDDYRHCLMELGRGYAPAGRNGIGMPEPVSENSDPNKPFLFEQTLSQAEADEWAEALGDAFYDGCVAVAALGCGTFAFLVLRGAAAGSVWVSLEAADGGVERVADSYRQWYEETLERL